MVEKTLGQIAFEAWEDSDGLNLPRREEYSNMRQNMRARWEAAAYAVRDAVNSPLQIQIPPGGKIC